MSSTKHKELFRMLENGEIENFEEIKNSIIPKRLFKYKPLSENVYNSIVEAYLWMTVSSIFNDPYDSQLGIVTEKTNLAQDSEAISSEEYKIFCLSEVNDSVLMWAHYAENHTGVCIEYNFSLLPDTHPSKQFLYPVHYSGSLLNADKCLKASRHSEIHLLGSLSKPIDLNYEKEWRIVVQGYQLQKFTAPPVRALYFGAKACNEKVKPYVEHARKWGIKTFRMEMSNELFKFIPIEFLD